jgi:Domain of unknown function (DUF1772)
MRSRPILALSTRAGVFSSYEANAGRLQGFFGGVTWVAGLSAIGASVGTLVAGRPGRWAALVAAILMVVAASTFFVYFERANASFHHREVTAADLPAQLARWAKWHWARTAISFGALAAALVSLVRALRAAP